MNFWPGIIVRSHNLREIIWVVILVITDVFNVELTAVIGDCVIHGVTLKILEYYNVLVSLDFGN